jgi:3-phosphoshikimate 1-carboxyvinyltransferase
MTSRKEFYRVEPGQRLAGQIEVPGDKSISHRAVMLGGVAHGATTIRGFLASEDCLATLNALAIMGVEWSQAEDGELEIRGAGPHGLQSPEAPLDLGNSGTAMRLFMGLLAGRGIDAVLTGDESLRSRPMDRVAAPLRQMGAVIETQDGCAPVRIASGPPLQAIRYSLPVASAQIKSALLLAGLSAGGSTEIVAPAPTRDHTERMLESMGVPVGISDDGLRVTLEGPATLRAASIDVPGDLSSAAFFIVGACLGARESLLIRNVGINPTRNGVLTILREMGARIEVENERTLGREPVADLRVFRSELEGIEIPASLVPLAIDELPVVFVAAAAARGRTVVSGAAELRVKESDRIGVMARALEAVGVAVEERPDGMIVEGGSIEGGVVDSQGDHRVAMSFVIASLASRSPIEIRNTAPIATSFPDFAAVAARAGLELTVGHSRSPAS